VYVCVINRYRETTKPIKVFPFPFPPLLYSVRLFLRMPSGEFRKRSQNQQQPFQSSSSSSSLRLGRWCVVCSTREKIYLNSTKPERCFSLQRLSKTPPRVRACVLLLFLGLSLNILRNSPESIWLTSGLMAFRSPRPLGQVLICRPGAQPQ
jgi:hypothetical protein